MLRSRELDKDNGIDIHNGILATIKENEVIPFTEKRDTCEGNHVK